MSDNLHRAKVNKNDEFYTQYADIEKEVNAYIEFNKNVFKNKTILLPCDDHDWSNFTKYFIANFDKYGIKRLISTSYAKSSGSIKPSDFEKSSDKFDESKDKEHGKIFILERDAFGKKKTFEFAGYLKGDGDFQSEEVKELRDSADVIITNPPFSLFLKFLNWIMEGKKDFLIIGNKNFVTCKEIFPLIYKNEIWLGTSCPNEFLSPEGKTKKVQGLCRWFTNLEHNVRHQKMGLASMNDNIKYNKKLKSEFEKRGITTYEKYDNYDAIEVKYVEAIPSDYKGIMGVPPTFMDKYNPEQFEILGCTQRGCHERVPDTRKYNDFKEISHKTGKPTGSSGNKANENGILVGKNEKNNWFINEKTNETVYSTYSRIFIRIKDGEN